MAHGARGRHGSRLPGLGRLRKVGWKGYVVSKPFKGTINVDIRDSVPDWTPFEQPKAPDRAPSVLYIILDDVGYSAMGCYGGPIETPNIDRIAGQCVATHNGTPRRCARRRARAC